MKNFVGRTIFNICSLVLLAYSIYYTILMYQFGLYWLVQFPIFFIWILGSLGVGYVLLKTGMIEDK